MATVTLALQAMATRFELVLHGESATHLRAAGEESFEEIRKLDTQLSLYNPASDISRINAHASERPVRVEPRIFELIARAKRFSQLTDGAFDITVGLLMRCWGFMGGAGASPEPARIQEALARCGSQHLLLDPENCAIRFGVPGMTLDLGALGKGYALDRAAELLREAGVANAMLHGGTSSVIALGRPPEVECWFVAIEEPPGSEAPKVLAKVPLRDEALSVSALWGKSFQSAGQTFGHIIDPRSGYPVQNALLAGVASRSAAVTDALSTALLVAGKAGTVFLKDAGAACRAWIMVPTEGSEKWAFSELAF